MDKTKLGKVWKQVWCEEDRFMICGVFFACFVVGLLLAISYLGTIYAI